MPGTRILRTTPAGSVAARLVIGVSAVLVSCSGGSEPSAPPPPPPPPPVVAATITIVSGNGQSAVAGAAFSSPLVVRVSSATGLAVVGVPVAFAVATGSGSVNPTSTTTDAQGNAQTIATAVGQGTLTITATAAGVSLPATFQLTVQAPPAQAGVGRWIGTTTQNRPITLWVGSATRIDSLETSVRVDLGIGTCTVTYRPVGITVGPGGAFTAALTSVSGLSGTLTGTFSPTSVSGAFDVSWNSFIICGSSIIFGSGGNRENGTWSASRSPLTVSSFIPSSGPLSGGTHVTVNGWFENTPDSVRVGASKLLNVTRVSTTSLSGTTPPGTASGSAAVIVYSAGASATCANCFTYNPLPTVVSVTPNAGGLPGGTAVTVTGTGFPLTVDSVRFGNVKLQNLDRVSSTRIDGHAPAGMAVGPVTVSVFSSSAGSADCPGCFSYFQPATWSWLTTGSESSCALTASGAAFCWGDNNNGKLGDGSTTSRSKPVAVSGGLSFSSMSSAVSHTCGVSTSGAAYCWGENNFGELGDSTLIGRLTPVAVNGGRTYTRITTGSSHTCGLTTGGTAFCWGQNSFGRLGDGTTTNRRAPTAVTGGHVFTTLSAGSAHTCGLTAAGVAYCWGSNSNGQLGDSTNVGKSNPTAVKGGLAFTALDAGDDHTCGLTTAGTAYCWGDNSQGQLGDSTRIDRNMPVAVRGGLSFGSIDGGGGHTCGLRAGGAAHCWGDNSSGRLGDGSSTDRLVPAAVSGGLSFTRIIAAWAHTCGLTMTGVAYCWGLNLRFQLGDGTSISRLYPTLVSNP